MSTDTAFIIGNQCPDWTNNDRVSGVSTEFNRAVDEPATGRGKSCTLPRVAEAKRRAS